MNNSNHNTHPELKILKHTTEMLKVLTFFIQERINIKWIHDIDILINEVTKWKFLK